MKSKNITSTPYHDEDEELGEEKNFVRSVPEGEKSRKTENVRYNKKKKLGGGRKECVSVRDRQRQGQRQREICRDRIHSIRFQGKKANDNVTIKVFVCLIS